MRLIQSLLLISGITYVLGCGNSVGGNGRPRDCTERLDSIAMLMDQRRYEEVIILSEDTVMCDTFSRDRILMYRANAFADLGQYTRSINVYSTLIVLRPGSSAAHYNRGLAYDQIGKYEEALNDYNIALELDSDLVVARINRAEIFRKTQNFSGATSDLDFLMKHGYKGPDLYSNYGATLSDQGKYSESLEYYKWALEIDSVPITAFNYSIALYHLGEYKKSVELMNVAVRLNPGNRDFIYNRALIKVKLNDRTGACEDFERARQMGVNVKQDVEENCM